MPMKKGSSRKVISKNIEEFHQGKTYEHTKEKFGKERADKQAVAAALSNARRSRRSASAPKRKKKSNFWPS